MNPEHVEVVRGGWKAIGDYRRENPDVVFDLSGASLWRVNLQEADLSGANLRQADLREADLQICCLERANLWSSNLKGTLARRANIRDARLQSAILDNAQLQATDLLRADLRDSIIQRANLRGANLHSAQLQRAKFHEVDLTGTKMQHADLQEAHLLSCVLEDIDLTGALFGETKCVNIDFTEISNLNAIRHSAPSLVDQASLRILNGHINKEMHQFLRDIGLEEYEIEFAKLYDPALTAEQVSEHISTRLFEARTPGNYFLGGVFVSYSHEDKGFAAKLYESIRSKNISTYLDRHDFTAGSIEKNIARAVRLNDHVVLVLSEHSLTSDWVWHEITKTLEKEKREKRDILFPVSLDDTYLQPVRNKEHLIETIRSRVIPDFSNPSTFKQNLQRLITGMKVNQ